MVSVGIEDMKRILTKNPKSLIFAQYVDALRRTGDKQKLDEALQAANKGLETNPDFSIGKLARGRIFFEKGDFANAKTDFENVAKQDPFCIVAHKLLIETVEKLSLPYDTEINSKILKSLDPDAIASQPTAITVAVTATATATPEVPTAPPPTKAQMALSAALDDIVKEEEQQQEIETGTRLLKAVDSIIESVATSPALPDVAPIFDQELPPAASATPEPKLEPMPEAVLEPVPEQTLEPMPEPKSPNLDDILQEQLADKPVDNLPDLTETMDSLLSTAVTQEATEEVPMDSALDAPLAGNTGEVNIDSILQEQLADRTETPDLTGDLDALLATAQPTEPAEPEPEPELQPYIPSNSAPNLDDILKEQLADRSETPDLTGDLDALLATAQPTEPAEPEPEPELQPYIPSNSAPNLDDILKEQLADRSEAPDLTGDLDALLATAQPTETAEPEPEPDLKLSPQAPNLDDLLKEQLADKTETPDLTGDLDALLATAPPIEATEPEPELKPYVPSNSAPDIDDLIKEQLADKPVGDIPDLTGDMDMLLATETLAEHYMDQKLPEKAVAVYKELLSRDPDNDELKAKLDLAATQIV